MSNIFDVLNDGINILDIESLGFKPAPIGQYIVRLVEVEGKTAKSGAPMLVCVFEIVEDMDGDTEFAGKRIWHNFTLSREETNGVRPIQFFVTFLECLDIEMPESIDAELIEMLVGLRPEVGASVIQDEYDGTTRNKIKFFSSVS